MKDLGQVDLVVIGGGVNGAGIARDAQGRGLKTILCEKDDLAEGTSSRSGKLIHGGLRYLEYYEFRLVREALKEREVLLKAAPHIVWPMRFVLPHSPDQRSAWLVRLGLFLYDHLGGRVTLPGCSMIDLHRDPKGAVIKSEYARAFEYSDCWVDDARLVVLNAIDARQRGAMVLTRTAATSARRTGNGWDVEFKSKSGEVYSARARGLVNAAGPWVEDVLSRVAGVNAQRRVRLVKGSHIIVPKFWEGPHAYVLQNHDKRLIFVNPYQGDKALIGTTDVPVEGKADGIEIDPDEIGYLIAAVNRYMKTQLTPDMVLSTYAGVRPLYDDSAANPSAVTRDYVFDVNGDPPLLSVFGGKITTYRKLAEHALAKLAPFFPRMNGAWTAGAALPGGDTGNFAAFRAGLSGAPPDVLDRLGRLYGTCARDILAAPPGRDFGHGLNAREVDYLMATEWAAAPEDVLDRRTKLGLVFTTAERHALARYMTEKAS
jgi:glycerol-3-phosphate dehydrogenase